MTTTTAFIVLCGALLVNGAFIKHPPLDGRITVGFNVDIEDYPYQLSLRSPGKELCGASIISENWGLTTASCVYQAESIVIRAGSTFLSRGGSLHQATEVIMHGDFIYGQQDYNYALVRVDPPFTFGPGVQSIRLADTEPAAGDDAMVSGWGTDDEDAGAYQEILRYTDIVISDRKKCGDITPRIICAPVSQGGGDICWGDAGGPMVVNGRLAGIAAFVGCRKSRYPSLYSNVANQRDWIREKTGI